MAASNNIANSLIERNKAFLPSYIPQEIYVPGPHFADVQRTIILTCMDHRLHPEAFLGLAGLGTPVIRNAGGRARNAVFDIAFLDTFIKISDIVVVHHTNCGLTLTSDAHVCAELGARSKDELAKFDVNDYCFTDVPQSVRDDVEFLRKHPWVRAETRVMGFLYETDTGKLRRVDDGVSDGGRDM